MSIEKLTKEKSNRRKKYNGIVEDIRYYDTIPDEVLGEMTPEIIEQYYLWDEVIKKEIERYPWLILPLIREVFYKTYPENIEIKLLATEYVVRRIHKESGSTLKYLNQKKDGKKMLSAEAVRKDLTEFIRECIMIIDREKGNGTLTDEAGKEIIEFLDMTCSYLLKNEPELKKEVRRIMRPIVMTQTERIGSRGENGEILEAGR